MRLLIELMEGLPLAFAASGRRSLERPWPKQSAQVETRGESLEEMLHAIHEEREAKKAQQRAKGEVPEQSEWTAPAEVPYDPSPHD